jgi:glutaminyl-peptide cyclotransferase
MYRTKILHSIIFFILFSFTYTGAFAIINGEYVTVKKPVHNEKVVFGKIIDFEYAFSDSEQPDSISCLISGKLALTFKKPFQGLRWNTSSALPGSVPITHFVYKAGKVVQVINNSIFLLSDIKPLQYTFKVSKVYPHDKGAYTQGLVIDQGVFYESTGLYGKSTIRRVIPESGKIIMSANISPDKFGEGLALINDLLYQVTWREQTCFVYNKKTLAPVKQFRYNIGEGWGLTYDGQLLLMSDGSSTIYKVDPQLFTVVGQFQVVSDKGPVQLINEMEYVNGFVYANIYQTNTIIIFNPSNGKVTGTIDCSGLLKPEDKLPDTDVLNGIAYNPSNKHFYVTGKNWPKLFEGVFEKK